MAMFNRMWEKDEPFFGIDLQYTSQQADSVSGQQRFCPHISTPVLTNVVIRYLIHLGAVALTYAS